MKDVMIDLETFGKSAGCIILSIGAVPFDLDKGDWESDPANHFHAYISTESCREYGLKAEASTLEWWADQSPEARETVLMAQEPTAPKLTTALVDFRAYLRKQGSIKNVCVWGNDSVFDLGILAAAYGAADIELPWVHYNHRCYRTLKNLYPQVAKPARVGVHHRAVDDALFQAHHATLIGKYRQGWMPTRT